MRIRYIADMHFDHADIIAYDDRPFGSAEEMNEVMIGRWNAVCGKEDLTYILGDFCAGGPERWRELLERLSGRKFLMIGNHDNEEAVRQMCREGMLEGAAHYLEADDEGKKVVLCHYPIVPFHNHLFGWSHLYGHVHVSFEANMTLQQRRLLRSPYAREDICRMANIGAMQPYMDYTPRTLNELEYELQTGKP